MKQFLQSLLLCGAALNALPAMAAPDAFSFGVISHPFKAAPDEAALRDAIEQADSDNLAFVVANGIKAVDEPCTDRIYNQRKALLHTAKNGLIVSLAASDWAECKGENGKSSAVGKLNRLRDLFFTNEFSLGSSKIPVIRQSTTAKFRSYVENARWEVGDVMFATVNLPSNNNHYVSDAGRNSEFEDRLIANHDWLRRVFIYASRKKLTGIVLFCDGNPLFKPENNQSARDGFAETRRHIMNLAAKYPGKVLLVHGPGTTETSITPGIVWRGNLGELDAGSGWVKLTVSRSAPALFTVENDSVQAANHHQ